jgi:Holliday junction resolvasome RuvABC endonuclease subunit
MRILALDPATKCGWARIGDAKIASGVWDLSIRKDESGGMRLLRLESKLNVCLEAGLDLVVFEAARNATRNTQGALVVQALLQGVIVLWCEKREIDYRGFSPSEIKKHATGKGNANKDLMLAAARQRGWHPVDDNHADALWLLDLARKEYGS